MAALVVLASWYRRRRDVPRRLALDQGWPLPPEPEEPPLDEAGPAP